MRAINLMTFSTNFGYEYELSDSRAVWTCRRCPPQEQRADMGKIEFPCRPTLEACFNNVIQVIDPRITVECVFCPPGSRPDDAWCQWVFSLPKSG